MGFFLCLVGCQPGKDESTKLSANGKVNQVELLSSDELPPLLTLAELISANDVQVGIKQAVLNKDHKALLFWQEQLISAGIEVRLSQRDLDLISGEQGLLFIEFEAKKQLFNDEFMKRFVAFATIDDVVKKYPFLSGVHDKAYKLISERDKAIQRAAQILQEEGFAGDATLEARTRWIQFMHTSGNLNKLN